MHHLKEVEGMSLRTVEYCVFDEADRLFEMGFAAQLKEILAKMNDSRQVYIPLSFGKQGVGGMPLEIASNNWAEEQQSYFAIAAASAAHYSCSCCLQLHELCREQAVCDAHSTAILPTWIFSKCMHGTGFWSGCDSMLPVAVVCSEDIQTSMSAWSVHAAVKTHSQQLYLLLLHVHAMEL